MIARIIDCRISVGKNAKRPLRKLCRSANQHNYQAVDPWRFRCLDCKCEWGDDAISVGCDLANVSCSNCYSDRVMLSQYRIEVVEAKDLEVKP